MNKQNRHIKDPGSAITHFIGMLMAIFAAIPLLIQASREQDAVYLISLTVYAVSLRQKDWNSAINIGMGNCDCWNLNKSILGILPEVGVFRSLYWDGMDLCTCFWTDVKRLIQSRIWMVISRWNYLHHRRNHLCIKASDIQYET